MENTPSPTPPTPPTPPTLPTPPTSPATPWIWLSILASLGVIVWAFTIPMRHKPDDAVNRSQQSVSTTTVSRQQSASDDIAIRAQQYRAHAIEMDAQLMKIQRKKDEAYQNQVLPGEQEAQAYQANYRKRILEKIKRLATAEKGSPDWVYRQRLIDSLEAPQ